MPLRKNIAPDTMGKWRPENRYLISSDSDWVISSDAEARRTSGGLPRENCFTLSNNWKRTGDRIPMSRGRSHDDWEEIKPFLSHLTQYDRLDITGHGSAGSFENKQPHEVAKMLVDAGLKEIGVIKFHSCDSGRGSFLEDVGHELKREWKSRGITAHDGGEPGYGHISGIEGASINTSTSHTLFGKRFNVGLGGYVTHGGYGFGNFLKNYIYNLTVVPQAVRAISKKEYFHIRSVPGNIPVTVHGTRYKADPDQYERIQDRYRDVGSTAIPDRMSRGRSRGTPVANHGPPPVDPAMIAANERLLQDNITGLERYYAHHDDPTRRAIEALLAEDVRHLDRQKRWAAESGDRANRIRSR